MNFDSSYGVFFDKSFSRSFAKNIPKGLKKSFDQKLKLLSNDPKYPSLNIKKLNVSQKFLKVNQVDEVGEFRINLSYRCIFYLVHAEKQVILVFVGDHQEVKKFIK
ncbi:MAG: hypothetical protein WCV93_05950 [Candidatus Shapirobacteria bacterium]|jgi:plasmid maintenance system killer protein